MIWMTLVLLVGFVLPAVAFSPFLRHGLHTAAPDRIVATNSRAAVAMQCGVCGGSPVDTSCGHGTYLIDAGSHKEGATLVVVSSQLQKGTQTTSKRREGCCPCCPVGCTCCMASCQCQY